MTDTNVEQKLVEAAKRGDSFAMKKLYEDNYSSVCRLAGRYTGNREDAEDIVQDVFIKAFNSLGKFKVKNNSSGSFGGWVYRICINLSINHVKRKKKVSGNSTSPGREMVSDESTPDEMYQNNEIQRRVFDALESLSPKQKMIFVLKHFEGLKITEIAEKMDCSSGSIKKQLFRATEKLRYVLDNNSLIKGEST